MPSRRKSHAHRNKSRKHSLKHSRKHLRKSSKRKSFGETLSRKASQGWSTAKRKSREAIDWISKNKLKFLGGVAGTGIAGLAGYYGYNKYRGNQEHQGKVDKKVIATKLANKLKSCFGTKTADGTKQELTATQKDIIDTLKNPKSEDSFYTALAQIDTYFKLTKLPELHSEGARKFNNCIDHIEEFKTQLQQL
jgi:hypothetical protein